MGKKSKKTGDNNKQTDDDATQRKQPLQAVLLVDDYDDSSTFQPTTLEVPKMLCPVLNVTMIDYTLDFLARSGVEQVFCVCATRKVQDYIETTVDAAASMTITVICDSSITNAGDALREVDKRQCVESNPFVLCWGDVITNLHLQAALQAHKARHEKDASSIMTLVMKPVAAACCDGWSHARPLTDDLIVGLDPSQENRIVLYDNDSNAHDVSLPTSFFAAHSKIDLRCDLVDTGIDICSPEVLARIADEFDYRDLRREFVANSVAEEEEGLQNKLYAHLVNDGTYVARIRDWNTYANISMDLLKRWCYPVVPENVQRQRQSSQYVMQRHYLYQERRSKTRIARSSQIVGPGMIGKACQIGANCQVLSSVLGPECRIGDGARVESSFLWQGVQVEAGARVVQSVLCQGVVVQAGAVIPKGCVIGPGCLVGKGVVLKEFTRLTLQKESSGDDFDDDDDWGDDNDEEEEDKSEAKDNLIAAAEVVSDAAVVGPDGKGRVWTPPDPDDDDDEGDKENEVARQKEVLQQQSLGYDPTTLYKKRREKERKHDGHAQEDEWSEAALDAASGGDENYDGIVTFDDNARIPAAAAAEPVIVGRQKGINVIQELKAICLEVADSTSSSDPRQIENLAIELNSFKFSQNATYSDCTMAAMLAIVEQLHISPGMSDGKLVAEFKSLLEIWSPLLRKMSMGVQEEQAMVLAMEQAATNTATATLAQAQDVAAVLSTGASFRFLLQTLHDEEIVSEDAILAWAKERRDQESSLPAAVEALFALQPVQDFLEWLAEEDESEEDDEEDEDDDDDEHD